MHEVEAALHRESNGLAMHGSLAEIEAAAVAVKAHLQFVKGNRIGVDLLASLGVDRRGSLEHEPAQGRFVAQDEIVDHKDAGERIWSKAHADCKPAALHMFVEVEERQKRSRVFADEIKLGRGTAIGEIAGYRLAAESSRES